MANPARPGLWQTITLTDGTTHQVQLRGDERCHFLESADGRRFTFTAEGVCHEGVSRSEAFATCGRFGQMAHPSRRTGSQPTVSYTGNKKGLIILAEFQNKWFAEGHDQAFYQRVTNEQGFHEGRFRGSVKDYFHDQSNGLFELDFDVVGPVRVSQNYEYYGGPSGYNIDAAPWEMVVEACEMVKDQVDWSQYDWNQDGYVNQLLIIFAGKGNSYGGFGGGYDAIWPHQWWLSEHLKDGDGSHYSDVYYY